MSRVAFLILAWALFGTQVPAAAKMLVVASAGPSSQAFKPGTVLPDSAELRLKQGDFLSVLTNAGVRNYQGPAKVRIDQGAIAAPGVQARLQQFLEASRERHAVVAAARAMGEKARAPSGAAPAAKASAAADASGGGPGLWQIAVQSGTWCVNADEPADLWRPSAKDGLELSVTALEGGSYATRWGKGETTAPWPEAVPIRDGAQYVVRMGQQPEAFMTLRLLNEIPVALPDLMEKLYTLECDVQLQQLAGQ
jgi:hypothetical protein